MKWITLTSIFFCAANFVASVTILIISCYNMTTTSRKNDRLPLPALGIWRNFLTQIISAMVYIITISVLSCWGVTRKRKPVSAMMVMVLHIVALGLCIVYCKLINQAAEKVQIKAADMKNNTMEIYRDYIKHHEWDTKWVPTWLTDIQEHSVSCCGILGYEDWKDFWPENPTEVPESCCHNENECITNKDHIEWPEIPATYIKTKSGCASLISEAMEKKIIDTANLLVLLTVMIGLALVIFACQYTGEFCREAGNNDNIVANEKVANLTVGETWARMGFNRTKKEQKESKKKGKGVTFLDDSPDLNFDILPAPGSYTDIYIKQLQATQMLDQPDTTKGSSAGTGSNTGAGAGAGAGAGTRAVTRGRAVASARVRASTSTANYPVAGKPGAGTENSPGTGTGTANSPGTGAGTSSGNGPSVDTDSTSSSPQVDLPFRGKKRVDDADYVQDNVLKPDDGPRKSQAQRFRTISYITNKRYKENF